MGLETPASIGTNQAIKYTNRINTHAGTRNFNKLRCLEGREGAKYGGGGYGGGLRCSKLCEPCITNGIAWVSNRESSP